jgi:hypothetical protein
VLIANAPITPSKENRGVEDLKVEEEEEGRLAGGHRPARWGRFPLFTELIGLVALVEQLAEPVHQDVSDHAEHAGDQDVRLVVIVGQELGRRDQGATGDDHRELVELADLDERPFEPRSQWAERSSKTQSRKSIMRNMPPKAAIIG